MPSNHTARCLILFSWDALPSLIALSDVLFLNELRISSFKQLRFCKWVCVCKVLGVQYGEPAALPDDEHRDREVSRPGEESFDIRLCKKRVNLQHLHLACGDKLD